MDDTCVYFSPDLYLQCLIDRWQCLLSTNKVNLDARLMKDKSLTVTHKLGVLGGCVLVLSIITGPFGINVGGIPGSDESPHVLALFSCFLPFLGAALIAIGLFYLGLEHPIVEEDVEVRKLELQELVQKFQHEAESHAQVCENVP